MRIELEINGEVRTVEAAADTPLLWVLRESLDMTGTKFGCGRALCGACTVHVDGEAVRACVFPAQYAQGKKIRTIEGLESDRVGRAVVGAWIDLDVVQCGWCQPGQCMSAAALLAGRDASKTADDPVGDAAIDAAMSGNICRCGAYSRIRKAIKLADQNLRKGEAR